MGRKKKLDNPIDKVQYVTLTCGDCNTEKTIRTGNLAIYTDEVRKNYKCLSCKRGA